jgi:hypothetical protein
MKRYVIRGECISFHPRDGYIVSSVGRIYRFIRGTDISFHSPDGYIVSSGVSGAPSRCV